MMLSQSSSNGNSAKITSFTDIHAWKEGHKLIIKIYAETKKFPHEEQFGLTSQLRRAVVSIASNIAEGFARSTWKDKAHFYSFSMGSVTEVLNQLLIARDLRYISDQAFSELYEQAITTSKLTKALLKKTQSWS